LLLLEPNDERIDEQIEIYDAKIVVHHIVELNRGGGDSFANMFLIHEECHRKHRHKQATFVRSKTRCNWDISHWRF
jgi:5-methylcytosine-specific restriction endonuclease McrA